MLDLTYLENIAIGGRTGCGKSVLINKMIEDFQKKYTPQERQLVLIDTKCVEMSNLYSVPHIYGHIFHEENEIFDLFDQFVQNVDDIPKTIIIDEISDLIYENAQKVTSFVQYCKMHQRLNIIFASQNTNESIFLPNLIKYIDYIFCFDTVLFSDKRYLLGDRYTDFQLKQGEFVFLNRHNHTYTQHSIDEL